MKQPSTIRLFFILAAIVFTSPTFAIQTQEVDLGRSGAYDGLVKIARDGQGRMTLCDAEVTSPVTLNDLRYSGTAHWLLQGLENDDHTQYHNDARALTWLGTRSTSDLPEGSRLYHTDSRARAALSAASPLLFNPSTGVFSTDSATTAVFTGLTLSGMATGAIPFAASGGRLVGDVNRLTFSNGNAGIGTSAPTSPLDVRIPGSTYSTNGVVANFGVGAGTDRRIEFYRYFTSNPWIETMAISAVYGSGGNNSLALNPWGGNVGIGTVAPALKLDVNGACRIRGALAVDAETTVPAINIAGRARLVASAAQSLTTDTQTIACNAALVVLDATANRSMSSTPTIAAGVEGQTLTIVNQNATYYVRLYDADSAAGTNLALASTSRTLYRRDVLTLIYTGGMWCEMYYSSNH